MLEGIRILDLTHRLAGPFGTTLLAEMGAEVIKVEPPEGDLPRTSLPQIRPGVSEYFATFNQAKQFVCINLKHPKGKEALLRLAKASDAMVDNFRPGTLDRLGLSLKTLREVNPGLVSVSMSGFGTEGPYKDRPVLDQVIQGMSGLMSITGERTGPPMATGIPLADMAAGVFGALAIVSGILGRRLGHEAGTANLSMLQAQQRMMSFAVFRFLNGGEPPIRQGIENDVAVPANTYATSDGWINVVARGEDYWQEFAKRIGRADLIDEPRFRLNNDRVLHRKELNDIFSEAIKQRTTEQWLETFQGLIAGPVYTVPEAFGNEHVVATKGVIDVVEDDATFRIVDNPIRWQGETTRTGIPRALGADTAQVLTRVAGYSAAEVDELRQAGAVITT